MRLVEKVREIAEKMFSVVHVNREGNATNREVQCEGDRDETETGREIFPEAWSLGPAGFKHRAAAKVGGVAKEKGLVLTLGNIHILIGAHLEDGEPSDLDEGDTAMYSADGAQVRCKGGITEVTSDGVAADDWATRADDLKTEIDANSVEYGIHWHMCTGCGLPTGTPMKGVPPGVASTMALLTAAIKSIKLKLK